MKGFSPVIISAMSRPVTGRLLAGMMTGAEPYIDPTPYRADRF